MIELMVDAVRFITPTGHEATFYEDKAYEFVEIAHAFSNGKRRDQAETPNRMKDFEAEEGRYGI